eukprot:4427287-Karenia_brevis.AAC.1
MLARFFAKRENNLASSFASEVYSDVFDSTLKHIRVQQSLRICSCSCGERCVRDGLLMDVCVKTVAFEFVAHLEPLGDTDPLSKAAD